MKDGRCSVLAKDPRGLEGREVTGLAVREPLRPISWPITEFRQEMIRSEGVLCDDSFPIDDAMLRRAELDRLNSLREIEPVFKFA